MPQLTQHFHSREFRSHDGAPLPVWHRRKLRALCREILEPMRSEWGAARIHSGHRSSPHNERVGGAPRSMHLAIAGRPGAAADVSFERGRPQDWARSAEALGAGGIGLYATFVHIDTRSWTARW